MLSPMFLTLIFILLIVNVGTDNVVLLRHPAGDLRLEGCDNRNIVHSNSTTQPSTIINEDSLVLHLGNGSVIQCSTNRSVNGQGTPILSPAPNANIIQAPEGSQRSIHEERSRKMKQHIEKMQVYFKVLLWTSAGWNVVCFAVMLYMCGKRQQILQDPAALNVSLDAGSHASFDQSPTVSLLTAKSRRRLHQHLHDSSAEKSATANSH